MADRPWKQFERAVAAVVGGRRHWANSGEAIDVESACCVVQAKLVKTMSLEALTQLAERVDREALAKGKIGLVAIKVRRGQGRASPMLIVTTGTTWRMVRSIISAVVPSAMAPPKKRATTQQTRPDRV